MEDTIAAISTPIGEGGIAIIRVSGPRAFDLADRVFSSAKGRPTDFPTHTIHFGTVRTNGELIDEVMLAVMRGPRTYTREDTIEINCHGGILAARKLLSVCLQNGARLAEPGEFTKRAFLNGRLDLTQAEAVMDIIRARTERAHQSALAGLEGRLSAKINEARESLISILAHIEAHIDFPEEDIVPDTREKLIRDTNVVLGFLQSLLATFHEGKILRDGIPVAIVGRPNVGKSSLLNALLGENRSIVTPVPGTTRDTVEEFANIAGIPFRFTDTAGIRHPRGHVEALGVERTAKAIQESDIVLHVIDTSRPFSRADLDISSNCSGKHRLLILNKSDLPMHCKIPPLLANSESVTLSAISGVGLAVLCNRLIEIANSGAVGGTGDLVAINERHQESIARAINSLTSCKQYLEENLELEIVSQQMRIALNAIGEVTGKTTTDDILARIFSTFCIGK